jgi:hypothetical protein
MTLRHHAIVDAERAIARQAISDLLAAGYLISVNDGNKAALKRSKDADAIFAAMFNSTEEYLFASVLEETKPRGWVRFVYQNEGWDTINDYTTNLEETLGKTNRLADQIEQDLRP